MGKKYGNYHLQYLFDDLHVIYMFLHSLLPAVIRLAVFNEGGSRFFIREEAPFYKSRFGQVSVN